MADVDEGRIDVVILSVTQPFLSADSNTMARRKGLWAGGNVPFGYRIESRKLLPHADEAALVERIYSLYLEQRSDAAVVQLLDAAGTRTRQGRRWTAQSVARVLTNPVYAGYITLGEELNEGEHDALIARERFDQVQALRRSPDTAPQARGRNPDYLLRGLLHCACGYSLTPASTRRGKLVHRYYRCIAKDKQGKGNRIGTHQELRRQKTSQKERLDTLSGKLDQLQSVAGNADESSRTHYDARMAQLTTERDSLRARLRELELRLGALENLGLTAPVQSAALGALCCPANRRR